MAEEQRAPGLEGRAGAEGRALAAAVLEATGRLLAATDREGVKKPSRPAWVLFAPTSDCARRTPALHWA
jgi:hypothetical protein